MEVVVFHFLVSGGHNCENREIGIRALFSTTSVLNKALNCVAQSTKCIIRYSRWVSSNVNAPSNAISQGNQSSAPCCDKSKARRNTLALTMLRPARGRSLVNLTTVLSGTEALQQVLVDDHIA